MGVWAEMFLFLFFGRNVLISFLGPKWRNAISAIPRGSDIKLVGSLQSSYFLVRNHGEANSTSMMVPIYRVPDSR